LQQCETNYRKTERERTSYKILDSNSEYLLPMAAFREWQRKPRSERWFFITIGFYT